MPHDHPHPHDPAGHDHPHAGHNHAHDHLHSHMHDADAAEELRVLTRQFVEGYLAASDKVAWLRLAGVPFETAGRDGRMLKLVDVRLTTEWQVATASPSFGSRELSWLPYPGEMVTERTNMELVYVSLTEKRHRDLREILSARMAGARETA